jgi:hypothetical protein
MKMILRGHEGSTSACEVQCVQGCCLTPEQVQPLTQRQWLRIPASDRTTQRGRHQRQRSFLLAEQGFAGDGEQRPLVPRSRYSPRLKPGVRLHVL